MARRVRRAHTDPFTDLVFNTLLGITFLLIITIMLVNPEAKTGNVQLKAEYIITMSWKDLDPNDIDVWVEDPKGDVVWYRNPEAGLMHLDRDDRGMLKDTLTINGKTIENPLNQEIVTIRGVLPGEYVVNVNYYASETHKPVDVSVKVEKVNPVLEVFYYGTVTLDTQGDEKTVLRFTINPDATMGTINFLPKHLVQATK
jgi:hypothetical protein